MSEPAWRELVDGHPSISTASARERFRDTTARVSINRERVVLTTYGTPQMALIPLVDLAILEALKKYPDCLAQLEKVSRISFS